MRVDDRLMPATRRQRRSYDPRLRRLVREDGGQELARRLGITRTTVAAWRCSPPPQVVAVEGIDLDRAALHVRIAKQERRIELLTTIMTLLLALVRVSTGRLAELSAPTYCTSASENSAGPLGAGRPVACPTCAEGHHPGRSYSGGAGTTAAAVRPSAEAASSVHGQPGTPGGFYIEQHNRTLPHAAFNGQTPDEMYFGSGDGVPYQLEEARARARAARLEATEAQPVRHARENSKSEHDRRELLPAEHRKTDIRGPPSVRTFPRTPTIEFVRHRRVVNVERCRADNSSRIVQNASADSSALLQNRPRCSNVYT